MGNEDDEHGAGYTFDVADLANDPEIQARLQELAEQRERFLESLSPEERAKEEARVAAEDQAVTRLWDEDAHSYRELVKDAQHAITKRHHEIESDRKGGIIGTMTEVGRAYGLSGVVVGRILDQHGLRERVDVNEYPFPSPLTIALNTYEERQRARWAAFNATFRPNNPVEAQREREQGALHLMRGLVDGLAIHDHFDGRDYWISAKLAPFLEPHSKRKL